MDLISLFVILAVCAAIAVALVVAAARYPIAFLVVLVAGVLAVSCSRANDLRFEVSIVAESEDDRAAIDEAVRYATNIFDVQLGLDLVVTHLDVSHVATHTKGEALLAALQLYRIENPQHRASDATVLFTRRTLTRGFEGVATIGPACSASAAAVVVLRSDGFDGQILAHELLHTLGVPHDHAAGYLMSEHLSRAGSDYVSADTLLTVKAAPLAECMTKPAASSVVPAGTSTEPRGGGGAMGAETIIGLALLAIFVYLVRALEDAKRTITELRAAIVMLEDDAPPEFSLRDIKGSWHTPDDDTKRELLISFSTLGGMIDFHAWLVKHVHRARRNEHNGGGAHVL